MIWGLDLTAATDHSDAYEWAAVYLAHAALGVALVAVIAAALSLVMWRQGALAAVIASVGYGALWEGAVQRLGAGLLDAAVDWSAVTLGALVAYAAWHHAGGWLAGALLAAVAILWRGVRARR